MKKLLSMLLLATVPAFAGTFHCTWNLIDFTTTPYNVRQIRIQSIAPYGVHSNAIITGDYFDRQVNSSGSVTVSNLVNGRSYRVTFFGPTVQTVFTNSFDTNVTGLVNGADYIAAPITDGNLVGWSRTQADARFLRTNITQYLRQGTNIVFVTNGNSLTIHGTATGGSGLGNPLTENLDFDGWLATNVFGLRPQAGETIEIVNAVIDGTFTGNGQGLTNLYASTNLEVVVSGRGIANGLSTRVNDGHPYGPDTPGTTSGGFKEAWDNSVAGENVYGPLSASASIRIDGPVYFTNALVLSNRFVTALSIRGNNPINDMLIYAGTNTGINCIDIRGGPLPPAGTYNMPIDVRLANFGVSAVNMTTNVLMRITNYSHADIQGMNFTSWEARTNQAWGAGTSIAGEGLLPRASDLVGLVIGSPGENGTLIAGCNWGHLAVATDIANADHIRIRDNTYSLISFGTTDQFTNRWPVGSPYTLGYAIMGNVSIDLAIENAYFYDEKGGIFINNSESANHPDVMISYPNAESGQLTLAATYTNKVRFYINHRPSQGYNLYRATNNGTSWNLVGSASINKKQAVWDNNGDSSDEAAEPIFGKKFIQAGFGATGFFGNVTGTSNYSANVYSGSRTIVRDVPGISTSTNQFYIYGSGTNDGFWSWNSTSQSYTNPLVPGTAAISEQILTPGVNRITLTNADHNNLAGFDYVLTTYQWRLTNIVSGMWADVDDAIKGIWGWWSGPTNNTAVFDGQLTKLQMLGSHLSLGPGGIDNFDDINVIYSTVSDETVFLPDARTNNGRFLFIKNMENVTNTEIATIGGIVGQRVDDRSAFVLTNSLASVIIHCFSNRWYTVSLDEGPGVGGSGTSAPGGSSGQVQFNDGGVFGGDSGLTYNPATDNLTVAGTIIGLGNLQWDGVATGSGQNIDQLNADNLATGTVPGARLGGIGSSAGGFVTTNGSGVVEFSRNAAGLTNLNQFAFTTNRYSFHPNNTASGNASDMVDSVPEQTGNSIYYAGTNGSNPRMHAYYLQAGASRFVWGYVPNERTLGRTNCAITQYFMTTNESYFGYSLTANVMDRQSVSNSLVSGSGFASNDGTTLSVIRTGTNIISVSRVFAVKPNLTNAFWEFAMGIGVTVNSTNSVFWIGADADFY